MRSWQALPGFAVTARAAPARPGVFPLRVTRHDPLSRCRPWGWNAGGSQESTPSPLAQWTRYPRQGRKPHADQRLRHPCCRHNDRARVATWRGVLGAVFLRYPRGAADEAAAGVYMQSRPQGTTTLRNPSGNSLGVGPEVIRRGSVPIGSPTPRRANERLRFGEPLPSGSLALLVRLVLLPQHRRRHLQLQNLVGPFRRLDAPRVMSSAGKDDDCRLRHVRHPVPRPVENHEDGRTARPLRVLTDERG